MQSDLEVASSEGSIGNKADQYVRWPFYMVQVFNFAQTDAWVQSAFAAFSRLAAVYEHLRAPLSQVAAWLRGTASHLYGQIRKGYAKIRSSNLLVAWLFLSRGTCALALEPPIDFLHIHTFVMADTQQQPSKSEDTSSSQESKQCRICLSGPEDVQTSGRLIKPCLCKGSMQVSPSIHFYSLHD